MCLATTLDGKISDGKSRYPDFTSSADRRRLFMLRAQSDVILVGAQTVRHEQLAPRIREPRLLEQRLARGASEQPQVAILSRSGDLPWHSAYFEDDDQLKHVLVPATTAVTLPEGLHQSVRVHHLAGGLPEALAFLGELGHGQVLCEGGGTVFAEMIRQGLIDELHLTLAPTILGGGASVEAIRGPQLDPRPQFLLEQVNRVGDELHLVYSLSP